MLLRLKEIERTKNLFLLPANRSQFEELEEINDETKGDFFKNSLELFLFQSGLKIKSYVFISFCILSALFFVFIFQLVFSSYFIPLFFILGFFAPISYAESLTKKRAANFNSDYPQFLLAMSSSIKVGLTPYQAMDKAIRLFTKDSLLKNEVENLLKKIDSAEDKNTAIRDFGKSIRLPDLKLFRAALLLVMENGGRFAPTLARLATVSNNRSSLIRSAEVSTANMRMTANILLALSPIILLIISFNYEEYWKTLLTNNTANTLATLGSMIIISCYLILRKMSSFKA